MKIERLSMACGSLGRASWFADMVMTNEDYSWFFQNFFFKKIFKENLMKANNHNIGIAQA